MADLRHREEPWSAAGVIYQRKFHTARGDTDASERHTELYVGTQMLPCASLVCWEHITNNGCDCGQRLAHIMPGSCGRAINAAFGRPGKRGLCKGSDICQANAHPAAEDVLTALGEWWRDTHNEEPVFLTAPSRRNRANNTAARGDRSAASSDDAAGGIYW